MSTLADGHAVSRHFSDGTLVSGEGQQATIHPLGPMQEVSLSG